MFWGVYGGQDGATLIDGHVSGPTQPGVFKHLGDLSSGDRLEVERGDGTKLGYRVAEVEEHQFADIDMRRLLKPDGDAHQGLNLITCSGRFDRATQRYTDRTLVFAVAE